MSNQIGLSYLFHKKVFRLIIVMTEWYVEHKV